jgi:hypothetical protein
MSEHYDPYAPPPAPAPEPYPDQYVPPQPMPVADALTTPEPLVATEPVPALAGGIPAPADTRISIDGGALRMERVVEEIIAWIKSLAYAAV